MNIRSLMITAAAISAAATFQAPANAAVVFQGTPTSSFLGMITGTFVDSTTFTNIAAGSSLSLSLAGGSSVVPSVSTLTASFNGVAVPLLYTGNSFSGLFTPTAGNINTLVLTGVNAGMGVFTGTLTVLSTAVPEASTWAMMTIGFGALGYSLRRRRTAFNLA